MSKDVLPVVALMSILIGVATFVIVQSLFGYENEIQGFIWGAVLGLVMGSITSMIMLVVLLRVM